MNDISSKLVESPKEVAVALVDTAEDNAIDPLAIDDDISKVKCAPEGDAEDVAESEVPCDENAKESVGGIQNGNSETPAPQTVPKEYVKEEESVAKEPEIINTKPANGSVVENQDTIVSENETVSEVTVNKIEPQKETSVEPEETTERKVRVITEIIDSEESEEKDTVEQEKEESDDIKEVLDIQQVTEQGEEENKQVLEIKEDSRTEDLPEVKNIAEIADTKIVEDIKEVHHIKEFPIFKEVVEAKKVLDNKVLEAKKVLDTKVLEAKKLLDTKVLDAKKLLDTKEIVVKAVIEESLKETSPMITEEIKPKKENKRKVAESIKEITKVTSITSEVEMVELPPIEDKKIQEEKRHLVEKQEKPEVREKKKDVKVNMQPVNGDVIREDHATKRRASVEVETESPLKRLCQEVEKTFPQHDTMINDYMQNATKNNIDEIQKHTEQLLAEIQTLRELAQKKEHEWNNILHLKKVKEEILLRLLRRKQVLAFEKSVDVNGTERADPFEYLNQAKSLAIDKSDEISGLSLKQHGANIAPIIQPVMPVTTHFNPMAGLPPPYDKVAHMQNMPKPLYQPMMMPGPMQGFPRDMNGQLQNNAFGMPMGRQGPTKDVKSIIADYRQRNPDITPRRGRRMKSILNPNMMNNPRPIAPKVENMCNLTNLNMLFNNLDMNQKAMLERLQQMQAGNIPNTIFKDALVQFANMQQASLPIRPIETVTNPREHKEKRRPERTQEESHAAIIVKQPDRLPSSSPRLPPPPPYPEISLLPVNQHQETQVGASQNSLLHGILTKATPVTQSYSPTLAKLLTPERRQTTTLPTFGQAKNCGEITITPVNPAPPPPEPHQEKAEDVVQLDDEESPAASEGSVANSPAGSGSGRLVIDEGSPEEETPLCQGCRRRAAQFVCAGCANQWYCSRECQVAAWDDHSDMCTG